MAFRLFNKHHKDRNTGYENIPDFRDWHVRILEPKSFVRYAWIHGPAWAHAWHDVLVYSVCRSPLRSVSARVQWGSTQKSGLRLSGERFEAASHHLVSGPVRRSIGLVERTTHRVTADFPNRHNVHRHRRRGILHLSAFVRGQKKVTGCRFWWTVRSGDPRQLLKY